MKKRLLPGLLMTLSLLASACHPGAAGQDTEPDRNQEVSDAEPDSINETLRNDAAARSFDIKALNNLDAGSRLLADTYYKAGDIRNTVTFSLTPEGFPSSRLNCSFYTRDEVYESFRNEIASAVLETEGGRTVYSITPEFAGSEGGTTACQIAFFLNDAAPHITVSNDARLEGDYYCGKDSFLCPDVFSRILGKADLYLYPTEDLWLLRNEIYAAHGRKFSSEVLNRYFSQKSWYRAVVEPEDFSEAVLSEIEKKNAALIHQLEEMTFDERNTIDGINYALEWDRLPAAPYLSCLNQYDETGLSADLTKAKDMGVYYSAPGSISIPASITQEQLSVVQNGGEIDVVLNELTGETQRLLLDPNAEDDTYYGYLLYDQETPPEYGCETGITPDFNNGTYTLWQTSADTVMKTVYEGDIYILKGAVTGAYTSLGEASKYQTEIRVDSAGAGDDSSASTASDVAGNRLSYNSRGYFTAIYFLGD